MAIDFSIPMVDNNLVIGYFRYIEFENGSHCYHCLFFKFRYFKYFYLKMTDYHFAIGICQILDSSSF